MRPAMRDIELKLGKIRDQRTAGIIDEAAAAHQRREIMDRIGRLLDDSEFGSRLYELLSDDQPTSGSPAVAARRRERRDFFLRKDHHETEMRTADSRAEQLEELFQLPSIGSREMGSGQRTFGDAGAVEVYPPRNNEGPILNPDQGIDPAVGRQACDAFRSMFDISSDKNLAVAEMHIDGVQQLFLSRSGSDAPPGMVELPGQTQFSVVNSGFMTRRFDTESIILEHIALNLDPNAQGIIRLYTERSPCHSCSGIIRQYQDLFPNIEIIITHQAGR